MNGAQVRAKENEMADLTLKELLDATDAVMGDDGGKHRIDDKARGVVLERDRYRRALEQIRVMMGPTNRRRFVQQGAMAFVGIYNVVEDALAGKDSAL